MHHAISAQARATNLVPKAFTLKNGWGGKRPWHLFPPHPFFKGKALGTRLSSDGILRSFLFPALPADRYAVKIMVVAKLVLTVACFSAWWKMSSADLPRFLRQIEIWG